MLSVQLRVPEQMIEAIDKEISSGKFKSRSEAIKLIIYEYQEKQKTREFYRELDKRSIESKNKSNLIALKDL
ncbi:MAG TPA: ribbon-helix-helix domain-containing protein [archaeon]|nr:ribbon-helix-helix domain-containing protein [archaeon]